MERIGQNRRVIMATLYELTAQWAALVDAYDMAEDDEERAEALAALAEAEGDITVKAEAYARIMRNYQATADAFKAEAQRLAKKQKAAEAAVDRLKAALLDAMQSVGTEEIVTGIGKWRIQVNPWSCEILDEAAVPAKYHIPQPDNIDKRALLDDFKRDGEFLDGVEYRRTKGLRFR